MGHAPGGIDLARAWIDEFCPCLMDGVPVLAKLSPFQPARVFRRGTDLLRAPMKVADVVLDILLRDLGICRPGVIAGSG
jgi:hypothetical protein